MKLTYKKFSLNLESSEFFYLLRVIVIFYIVTNPQLLNNSGLVEFITSLA